MRIAIIDDEKGICECLHELLAKEGREIFTFKDPAKALEFFKDNTVDYVICDFIMPGLSGEEIISELPKGSYKKFILLTGETNASPEVLESANFDEVFFKPDGLTDVINYFSKL